MRTYRFKTQKELGIEGERQFTERYQALYNPIKSTTDLSFDFTLRTKTKCELKTDSYLMDNTPNYFMERWANGNRTKDGGPWRALNDSVPIFVYFFINNQEFHWFRTEKLIIALNELVINTDPALISVKSDEWNVWGYLIPRKDIENIVKIDSF